MKPIRNRILFGSDSHFAGVSAHVPQAFVVDDANFTVNQVGNFPRRQRKPCLIVMTAAHPGISILKDLIAQCTSPSRFDLTYANWRGLTLTLIEMLIQREKNVKASLSLRTKING
jgi:hypothetical protein